MTNNPKWQYCLAKLDPAGEIGITSYPNIDSTIQAILDNYDEGNELTVFSFVEGEDGDPVIVQSFPYIVEFENDGDDWLTHMRYETRTSKFI